MKRTNTGKPIKKPLISRPIRNRSEKDRPANVHELITAIDDGRLDGRTGPAKRITALRQAIAAAPLQAAVGVVRDALALDLTIAQAITAEVSRPGFQVLVDGKKLNPLLELWRDLQRSLIYSAQTLARLEGQPAPQSAARGKDRPAAGDIVDVSALVMAAADDDE